MVVWGARKKKKRGLQSFSYEKETDRRVPDTHPPLVQFPNFYYYYYLFIFKTKDTAQHAKICCQI